ncbi:MAG: hypothetical protein NTW19_22220 [Planctomycetota bacterium]|nr:hypothetical protein [Planctomycetota bacterium]
MRGPADAPFDTSVGHDGRLIYTPYASDAAVFKRYEAFREGR